MSLVNYLGTYETLDQVWEAYPEGGKEGDYLYIASVLKKWNKYTSAWADPTEEDVEGSTIMSLEEDVVVGSSTLINYLGRFETLENAINTYPEGGNEGDYIYVGDDIYAWNKYANGWFVSLDAPLEVAISEEDIIPNSSTFINYLGGFVDRDAVWQKYPEGGKVGDYLYIASDLHIWDKYICNWVAATPPDESSQIRPIEHLSQEGVVEYSENYINYLGVFESIEQAWEAYPEGGKEGDYIIVGGEQLRWNKYTSNWGEYDPDASTPARPVATIYGDLHVHNDVVIGEDLYARILETFTTKKWVLEQGYISMDDVTSELVMSKIVPDNTTIEVRDGKLVVIGGGGGGTADSVEWDNITGKPDWIGDTKPTYTLDEIAGSNGDGFVTLLNYQIIEGVKNFAKGIQIEGMPMYRSKDDTVYLDANLVVRGGVTMYGSNLTTSPSIFEALPIDNDTIKRNAKGELYAVGGGGSGTGGGGVADSVAWSNVTNKPTWITDTKPKYSYSEILDTPDLSVYAIKSSVDNALSNKADKATTLAGYGITNAYTKSEVNNIIDSLDDTYVTIAGEEQSITAVHNFVNGFKVGGLPIKKSQDKTLYLDANLVVSGAITMYGSDSTTFPTIWANIPFNPEHMSWNGSQWSVVDGGSGSELDLEQLEEYLTTNGYATQSWVTSNGYITASALEPYALKTAIPTNTNQLTNGAGFITGITSSMVTNALGYTPYNSSNPAGYITSSGSITGNAATATKLATTRSIWGQSFDGNADVSGNIFPSNASGCYYNENGISYHTNKVYQDEILRVTPSYNVAIGGTTASEKLHVYGNILATGTVSSAGGKFTDNVSIAEGKNIMMRSANAQYYAGIGYDTNGNECLALWAKNTVTRLRWAAGVDFSAGITVGAMMGITPDFEISKATGAAIGYIAGNTILHSDNYSKYALPLTGGVVNGDVYSKNYRTDGVAYIQRLRIENKNEINGYSDYNGGTATGNAHINYASSGIVTLCNGGGNCAIGGISATEKLHVYGNILATGAITMYYSSDKRLKQNIRKVNASKMLMSLGGVHQYEYIDSEVERNSVYGGTHYGLIYQNVKGTALKSMCHEREDGYGALNYLDTNFISLIAGATMENISEIEKLKRKIRTLENKVKQLERVA